ncbi:MAG: LptA/OstA family protein [Gemmataceae bacterium]|nr:LptA/OstA family protein [Gemmataceae bacterium]
MAVWTPKRILMLVVGFALFFSAYQIYAHFLGSIDGLPPLPAEYGPPVAGVPHPPLRPPPERVNEADRMLRLAFGDDCPESKRTIKLETRAKGLVLAADIVQFMDDGRVKLIPFSLALFGKETGPDKIPEITTVRSDIAIIKFDRPVKSIADMGNRRMVAGELQHEANRRREDDGQGGVTIVNNQRTWQRDDDVSVFTPGPVYYDEALHKIWTKEVVRLTDLRSRPNPTSVTAVGMDIYLAHEPTPPGAAVPVAPKSKGNGPSGVELVTLRSHVSMTLWVDANSGFLGGSRAEARTPARDAASPAPTAASASAAPERAKPDAGSDKAQVIINTQGPFTYNLSTAQATFDISKQPSKYANHVVVNRLNDLEGKREELVCEHLVLQLSRKNASDARKARGERQAPDLESAHATGNHVTLFSDAQNLHALGTDLFYDGRTKLTILKGEPEMHAAKEGNEIRARELHLRTDVNGQLQQARAKGPGRVELLNRSNGTRPLEARWRDELVSSKDGVYDVLTLTGDAAFEDKEHGQRIQANRLQVWLEPAERIRTPSKEAPRPLPHRLEAFERVTATSPEMHIHDTERLVVWFRDVAPPPSHLPEALPGPATLEQREATSGAPQPVLALPLSTGPGGEMSVGPAEAARPKQPIDLSARAVEAHVLRSGAKSDLEKLWCEGVVRVHQEPATPEERGVDIRGDTLRLHHYPTGNLLTVTGNQAQVHLNKLYIFGPEVNIDQTSNKVWVNGVGVMRLPSNTNFEGGKLTREVELVVQWNQKMDFDGSSAAAVFEGNVQADQDNARLLCQQLSVFLDRPVALKEGQKKDKSPAVKSLVCDKKVRVEEIKRAGDRLVSYQRIDCPELGVDNEDHLVSAGGPGEVRLLHLGTKGDIFSTPSPRSARPPSGTEKTTSRLAGAPPPAEEEYKLTAVTYSFRMSANNNTRTAIFYENVEVIHLPADDPHLPLNRDRLPPEAFYMRCEMLKVYSSPAGQGRTNQIMEASNKVFLQGQDFVGQANLVKYNAATGLIILIGSEGSQAILSELTVPGAPPNETQAQKIYYNRLTKQVHVEKATGVTVPNLKR